MFHVSEAARTRDGLAEPATRVSGSKSPNGAVDGANMDLLFGW